MMLHKAWLLWYISTEIKRQIMIEISVRTTERVQAVDITAQVTQAIKGKTGAIIHVYTPHTTCGLLINEAADPHVIQDIIEALNRMAPRHNAYKHAEGNSDAHIKSVLTGSSVSLPLLEGRPKLGTWQGIFFMEFDGPRERKIIITVT